MKKYFERFKDLIFDRPFEEIMDALEYEGPKEALKKSVPFLCNFHNNNWLSFFLIKSYNSFVK